MNIETHVVLELRCSELFRGLYVPVYIQCFTFPVSGLEYWKREDSEFSEDDSKTRYWYRAPSAEVEMTAYVLMAELMAEGKDALGKAQPIVQWLTRQRNPYGGFSSTQVTYLPPDL